MAKRRRGGQQEQEQRLYLILDDDPWGYSIREISLKTRSSSSKKKKNKAAGGAVRPLPEPIICLESLRGHPLYFSAVGTRIVLTRHINPFAGGSVSDRLMPIVDVRRRGVTFGPGQICQDIPIYVPVGAEVFALDTGSLRKLSFQPPPLDARYTSNAVPWSWRGLQRPPFDRVDVTSSAVHPDGQTILFCTDFWAENSDAAPSTFTFNTRALVWEKLGDWTLPFTGRAYFIHCLQAFVGLSKDPATLGHLASCETATRPAVWKLGKEKLFSEDPDETHVSATLVYTGSGGSEFCLVQCVAVEQGNGGNADDKNLKEPRPSCCYRYRLTTFSLSYDNNGDLTTGNTSSVQCFEVPRETTESFIRRSDPVAFWL